MLVRWTLRILIFNALLLMVALAGGRLLPAGAQLSFSDTPPGELTRIYLLDADRGLIGQLTPGDTADYCPVWSSDGSTMLFRQASGNTVQLARMNADGSGREILSGVSRDSDLPAWSPDGKRIAFITNGGLYVMNADGTGARRLVRLLASNPAWSPDSDRLVFTQSQMPDGSIRSQVQIIRPDGSKPAWLTHSYVGGSMATWSPDGTHIAFLDSAQIGVTGQIHVVDATCQVVIGCDSLPVSPNNLIAFQPQWTPDGFILFTARQTGSAAQSLYRVRPDGSDLQMALGHIADFNGPLGFALAPDGSAIAYVAPTGLIQFPSLYIRRLDGSLPRRFDATRPACPAWRP
jgi:TolB protein